MMAHEPEADAVVGSVVVALIGAGLAGLIALLHADDLGFDQRLGPLKVLQRSRQRGAFSLRQ